MDSTGKNPEAPRGAFHPSEAPWKGCHSLPFVSVVQTATRTLFVFPYPTQLHVTADPAASRNTLDSRLDSQESQKPTFPWEITITSFLWRSYRERIKKQSHPKKIKSKSPRLKTKIKGNLRGEGKLLKTGVGRSVGWFSAWFSASCFFPFRACRSRSTQGIFLPSVLQVCAEVQPQNSFAAPTAHTKP